MIHSLFIHHSPIEDAAATATEFSGSGDYVQQSWSSGQQSAGYTHQLDLLGDARNIKIFGEAATGLAWNPWGEAINVTEDPPTNKTYRIFGTTLRREHEISGARD